MGYAYTPGLRVTEATTFRSVRRLPLKGRVLVHVGQTVPAECAVAEAELPGEIRFINVASRLGAGPGELPGLLLKQEGDPVTRNEVIARTRGLFGLFQSECRAPIDGTIESVSAKTGQVSVRGQPTKLRKLAYVPGTVVDVQAGESATIEVQAALVQGIFGLGGEAFGRLEIVADSPRDVLDADRVTPALRDRVIVGGSLVTGEAIRAAVAHGVKGIISGGLNDIAVRDALGYELGVAITGEEDLGVTVIVTEGFGRIEMAAATFKLLCKHDGATVSVNGATQIRAGVIRPEVIVPLSGPPPATRERAGQGGVLEIGARLRAIREPYFGRLGRCISLPSELQTLASEARARVLEVEFDDGARATLPRANVELIEA